MILLFAVSAAYVAGVLVGIYTQELNDFKERR